MTVLPNNAQFSVLGITVRCQPSHTFPSQIYEGEVHIGCLVFVVFVQWCIRRSTPHCAVYFLCQFLLLRTLPQPTSFETHL